VTGYHADGILPLIIMPRYLLIILFMAIGLPSSASDSLRLEKGSQLFVDDYLIESTTLKRICHYPTYSSLNPVLKADRPWELNATGDPYAAPFSGGVWYDDADGKFKMWYSAGGGKRNGLITCYAESLDGKVWIKPLLDVVAHTNIVDTLEHDCVSVLLDKDEADPSKRYKMFAVVYNTPSSVSLRLKYSSDGIHWGRVAAVSGEIYDRTGVYYDPFRHQYVLSLKTLDKNHRRARNYLANKDVELLVSLAHRTFDTTSDKYIRFWFGADDKDPHHLLFPHLHPQIYNHEAIRYESLMLGFFTIWQGPENKACDSLGIQKKNEVLLGWSRDGFHWARPDRTPFLPVGKKGEWNEGNVQSTCGSPLIVGDSLYFYVSGRYNNPRWDSNFATGLAVLRRDGFVSMSGTGELMTKLLYNEGSSLCVNADVRGYLQVDVMDADGKVLLTKRCRALNKTSYPVWPRFNFEQKLIRLRFIMKDADLYAFTLK
jgi:hypothetical protein